MEKQRKRISKRIEPFKQFLKGQHKKKINEQSLALEVQWWDECLVEVQQDLSDECAGFLEYETLVKYVKEKFQILGRPDPGFDEALLLQHIKDLIVQHHGDSLVCDGMCNWGEDNSGVQAKGLVVSELAKAILDKVLETIPDPDAPIPGVTKVSLVDQQPRTLVPMQPAPTICDDEEECYDDLPFESKRPVKGFKEYTKKLNEAVGIIEIACEEKCIQYCLDRIMKEVGSYDPEPLLKVAVEAADPKVKARLVLLYVKDIVIDYLSSEKAQLALVDVNGNKGKTIPKDILEQGMDQLYHNVADDVLVKLAELNGISLSDGEVE